MVHNLQVYQFIFREKKTWISILLPAIEYNSRTYLNPINNIQLTGSNLSRNILLNLIFDSNTSHGSFLHISSFNLEINI